MTQVFYVPVRQHGVERTLSKSQHRQLTLEKKILPPLELATFLQRVWRSTNKLAKLYNPSNTHVYVIPHSDVIILSFH